MPSLDAGEEPTVLVNRPGRQIDTDVQNQPDGDGLALIEILLRASVEAHRDGRGDEGLRRAAGHCRSHWAWTYADDDETSITTRASRRSDTSHVELDRAGVGQKGRHLPRCSARSKAVITVVTAVMLYFSWRTRSDVQARAMEIDVTLFGFSGPGPLHPP